MRHIKPRNISDTEKYHRIGKLTDCQRGVLTTVIHRSREGLWTRYAHVDHIECPAKRMSEMIGDASLGIESRAVREKDDQGRTLIFMEYCVR